VRILIPIVLSTVVLVTSCQKSASSSTVRVDPALTTLVPANTVILVGAKLDKLRETQVYQKHFAQMPFPRLDDFAKQTGLDPRKDVWEVLFASDGQQSGVLMARGKFPTSELEPKLEQQGATRTRYKGYSLFGDERNAAFFMNSSTALAGSTAVLKTIIDNRDRSRAGIPASLQPQVNSIPEASQFWAVFSGSGINLPFAGDSNLGNLNQIVRSIENGRFSADLRNGFEFQANGNCTTDAEAKKIHDLLKGLVGIGRLSTPENQPDMLKVYDGIDVKQEGRAINVAANVSREIVDKFLGTFVQGRRR
jgi:hypothetical protein